MHIQKATFLAVQHWLLGTIATHFSVPPFVSLTFCVSHVICSQPSNAASTTQAWDQSGPAWLPPPCGITIMLNCLWNVKPLAEKQKMPFPSSNHCKETESLHWDHWSAAQVAPVEDKSLQLFTVIYQMFLTTFNFTFKWESDLEVCTFMKINMAVNWSTNILIINEERKHFTL